MTDHHNVFISHRREDDALMGKLKELVKQQGANVRDSTVTSEIPNKADDADYIESLLAERIQWADRIIVLVSPGNKSHRWVDWEIEYANKHPEKRIVGVWAPNASGCHLPASLDRHADAVVSWNADAIIRALDGEDQWQAADGSVPPARTIIRIGS